jgi:hypothetical protein
MEAAEIGIARGEFGEESEKECSGQEEQGKYEDRVLIHSIPLSGFRLRIYSPSLPTRCNADPAGPSLHS